MLTYPNIDPVAFSIGPFFGFGPFHVHWYGMMYLLGFVGAVLLGKRRARIQPWSPLKPDQVEDMIMYGALGVVLGGRLGYVFFYQFERLLSEPTWLFRVWEGGMSFHGGLLGVIIAMAMFARVHHIRFWSLMDFVAPLAPIGLGFGRIGNFIGQELWGRATDLPWAMIFPKDPEQLARHPSQLYQAALEGLALFLILFFFSRKQRPVGAISALFLICYGVFRFSVEFARQPDSHINFDLFGWVTRGQILSMPMIIMGIALLVFFYKRESQASIRSSKA